MTIASVLAYTPESVLQPYFQFEFFSPAFALACDVTARECECDGEGVREGADEDGDGTKVRVRVSVGRVIARMKIGSDRD